MMMMMNRHNGLLTTPTANLRTCCGRGSYGELIRCNGVWP